MAKEVIKTFVSQKTVKDATPEIIAALKRSNGNFVKVGWQDDERYPDDGPLVAQVAIFNEFGTYTADGTPHVPARPFMRPALNKNEAEIMALKAEFLSKVAYEKLPAGKALMAIGQTVQEMIRTQIKSNPRPVLAPATEAKKRKAGRPVVTLIDTRRMLDNLKAVTFLTPSAALEIKEADQKAAQREALAVSRQKDRAALRAKARKEAMEKRAARKIEKAALTAKQREAVKKARVDAKDKAKKYKEAQKAKRVQNRKSAVAHKKAAAARRKATKKAVKAVQKTFKSAGKKIQGVFKNAKRRIRGKKRQKKDDKP